MNYEERLKYAYRMHTWIDDAVRALEKAAGYAAYLRLHDLEGKLRDTVNDLKAQTIPPYEEED